MFENAYIPYKGYYSTPFVRWQGSLSTAHPVRLAGATAKRWLAERKPDWDPMKIDYVFMGTTVAMKHAFWNGPWAAALFGAERTVGVWLSLACATGTTAVFQAAMACEVGATEWAQCILCDRVSNGPHSVWPNPNGPGGYVEREDWVMDNFNADPWTGQIAMVATADYVAQENGITKEECDELAWVRYQQYQDGLANDRAFQKRYMFPAEVQVTKKKTVLVEADEGIIETSPEAIAALKPVNDWGVHSFAAQTHPADANASIAVCTREKAKELADDGPEIQIISFGYARAPKARMGAAPVPATEMALEKAGLRPSDIKAWKTHSPFSVNDVNMARRLGIDPFKGFNDYGCSMIYGHPHAATMARHIIELIEQLVMEGGGYGCASGCAAGDTGATLIIKVG